MFESRALTRALLVAFLIATPSSSSSFVAASTEQTAAAGTDAAAPSVRSGKYLVTLRIPSGGFYADEETDLEFRIVDASADDPVLGPPGVIRAAIASVITMPSMAGMPAQSEVAHAEGVPGDYGIHPVFPHGGGYLLKLTVTPPAGEPFTVEFPLNVKDSDPSRPPRPKPFELLIGARPSTPVAGEKTRLTFTVRDRAANSAVTQFDVAHEKLIHLMIIREDLGVFSHEHPELGSNGEFALEYVFPTDGRYRLFADIAPKGRGSQVVYSEVNVKAGKKGASVPKFVLGGPMPPPASVANGMKAELVFASALESGAQNLVTLKVVDATSGAPVTNLQPYLGAMGHMVLVHQDGTTYVHSHPDDAVAGVGKDGSVPFLARFAKAGWYRCWAQVQRGGQVATFSFSVQVGGGQ